MTGPRIGELFAGYGGLGMGVKAVLGGDVAWYSDVCKFKDDGTAGHYEPHRGPCRAMGHNYPGVPNHGDISAIDWSQVEPVDILTGGFPCQDVSSAGKRAGIRPGTRSGLWAQFAYAIDQLRPRLVVIENVRGLLSAEAHSDVEPCPWCVGDDPGGALRALGAVLGDLADLGYDAGWHGVRAADVGAPHGRFRVFITAWPAAHADRAGLGERRWPVAVRPEHAASQRDGEGPLTLMPTPRATDGTKGGPGQRGSSGDLMLPSAVALLPTPAVNDMGEGKTVEAWDDWTAKMKATHGNGNGHGASLAIEAQRLLPTPRASDGPDASSHGRSWSATDNSLHTVVKRGEISHAHPTEGRSDQVLRDVRSSDVPQEVRSEAGGSDALPVEEELLPGLREQSSRSADRQSPLAGAEAPWDGMSGLRNDEAAARSPRGSEPGEQRPSEPDDTLRELPPQAALAGGPREAAGGTDWGPYVEAIRRWERVLGRSAPPPTQLSSKGNPQLSPAFVEFLMGLPAGWVTDVPGITRNEALKLCGNGVVPQQAEAALRVLLSRMAVAA